MIVTVQNAISLIRIALTVTATLVMFCPSSVMAQVSDSGSRAGAITDPRTSGKPPLATQLPNQAQVALTGDTHAPSGLGSSLSMPRPEKPVAPSTPPKIKDFVEEFKTSREEALKQPDKLRKALNEKLKSASEEERAQLIAEFREKQKAWLEFHKAATEDFRQRANSIRDDFKNRERDQLLDDVKGKAQELRERIGKD
jgi:hypothetical protein